MASGMELLEGCIAELEAKLYLQPGQTIPAHLLTGDPLPTLAAVPPKKKKAPPAKKTPPPPANNQDQPDICKLEFKVGVITKVWEHPEGEKLYCEEIDVGEPEGPRQIASGLRAHYTLEQMQGQRLLVMSNLKARPLRGFKSNGMVLCAAAVQPDGTEKVEFVEPPADAAVGEVVQFEGLPPPQPWAPNAVDKKKVLAAVAPDLVTSSDGTATWKGHVFMTSVGPCKAPTLFNAVMR